MKGQRVCSEKGGYYITQKGRFYFLKACSFQPDVLVESVNAILISIMNKNFISFIRFRFSKINF